MFFCNGAHADVNFDGSETADNTPYIQSAIVYKGPNGDLLDKESLCAVARFCDKAGQIWNLIEKDDQASFQTARKQACDCPSGRLTVIGKNDDAPQEPSLPQEIAVIQDPAKNCRGPLWVKGGIQIEGADGTQYEVRNRITLCRCGQSSNMPFCDASHLSCRHMEGQDE